MKVLFTQDALVNAGAERSHLDILSRFSKEVDVGFVYFYPKHDLKEDYERAGIRLFFLDIPESYHFTKAVYRLVRLIRTEKPDLLVSCLWRADMITRIASLITGVPLVGTLVNDSYSPLAWTDKKGLKYKLVYCLDRLTAGIPVHWIANAQALVDSHVKTLGLKREKISVVYRGRSVIASVAKKSSDEETASASEIHGNKSDIQGRSLAVTEDVIASDEGAKQSRDSQTTNGETASASFLAVRPRSIRNFISYGRLLERKGFQDAIHAFSEVVKTYPDCTLTIYGEGSYRKELERLIQALGLQGSVFLPGKISNPMDLLISGLGKHPTPVLSGVEVSDIRHPTFFHCFLFPSWYEGFSGALVEAMMAGIPIIASDIPMNLEALTSDINALIFPVKDLKTFTQKMLYAIENPDRMEQLGQAARSEAIRRFDIEVIAKEYERVLKSVTRPKKGLQVIV